MELLYKSVAQSITLAAATPGALTPGGTAGLLGQINDAGGPGDVVAITLTETGGANAVETVTLYQAVEGGSFAPLATTTSLAASGTRRIVLRGFSGDLYVTGTSAGGATVKVDVSVRRSGVALPYQLILDGVVQGTGTGGTISGNLAQSAGTVSLTGNAASTITTSASTLSVDAATTLNVGASTATALVLGRSAVVPSLPGGASVGSAKAITGAGALAIEAAAGSTLTVGAASNAMVIGQAAKVATVNGDVDFQGALKAHAVDAGAAGTTGTASAYAGTFTLTGTTFTLTNTKISATSLVFVQCITASPGAYIASAVPTTNTLTVTMSAAVTAIKMAFLVVNPGA